MEHERILLIYDFLYKNTDQEHYVTLKEIREHLKQFNIRDTASVTIRRDIERIAVHYRVETESGPHNTFKYSMRKDKFTINELRFLIDAVSVNKFLNEKQKKALIGKFKGLCPENEMIKLMNRVNISDVTPPALNLLDNLEKLHIMITNKMRINFDYGKYDEKGKFKYNKKDRVLLPCQVKYFKEKFYLKGVSEEDNKFRTYRIDRMKNITELEKSDAKVELKRPDGVIVDAFETDRFEYVKMRISRNLRDEFIETFGKMYSEITGEEDEDTIVVRVKVGVSDRFCSWVLSYGDLAEVLEPADLRERMRETVKRIMGKYE